MKETFAMTARDQLGLFNKNNFPCHSLQRGEVESGGEGRSGSALLGLSKQGVTPECAENVHP